MTNEATANSKQLYVRSQVFMKYNSRKLQKGWARLEFERKQLAEKHYFSCFVSSFFHHLLLLLFASFFSIFSSRSLCAVCGVRCVSFAGFTRTADIYCNNLFKMYSFKVYYFTHEEFFTFEKCFFFFFYFCVVIVYCLLFSLIVCLFIYLFLIFLSRRVRVFFFVSPFVPISPCSLSLSSSRAILLRLIICKYFTVDIWIDASNL